MSKPKKKPAKGRARIEWLDPDTVGLKPVVLKPGDVAIMRGPVTIGVKHKAR
jgi:hypothetical protein